MAAIYPFVGSRERDAAIGRIAARHLRREDNRWSEAGTDSDDPARDVLAYLRRRHTDVPTAIAAADVLDELILAAWVHWDEKRRERELLLRARTLGRTLGEIGTFLGIATRQGAQDHIDRLVALTDAYAADQDRQHRAADELIATTSPSADGPEDRAVTGPTETAHLPAHADLYRRTRGRRPAHVGADPASRSRRVRNTQPADLRRPWIEDHRPNITSLINALLHQTARLGIAAEEGGDDDELGIGDHLVALRDALTDAQLTGATIGHLGLAIAELRDHTAVAGLPPNHGLQRVLARANLLRAAYANISR